MKNPAPSTEAAIIRMAISIIRWMLSRSATFSRSASALMPLTDFDTASITGSTAENDFRHRLQLVGQLQRLLHPGLEIALIVGKLLLEFGLRGRPEYSALSSPAMNSAFRFFMSSPYLRSRRSMKSFSCRRIVSMVISSADSCSWSTRDSISWTDARRRPSRPDFSSRPSWRFCSTTAAKCAWYFFSERAHRLDLARQFGLADGDDLAVQRLDIGRDGLGISRSGCPPFWHHCAAENPFRPGGLPAIRLRSCGSIRRWSAHCSAASRYTAMAFSP